MEQQQVARSSGADYRDEDELDSVPTPSSSTAVTTEFFPVSSLPGDRPASAGPPAFTDDFPATGVMPSAAVAAGPAGSPPGDAASAAAAGRSAAAIVTPAAADDGGLAAAAATASAGVAAALAPALPANPGGQAQPGAQPQTQGSDAQQKARRQSEGAPAPIIPDCCNVGVALRTFIVANAAALLMVAARAGDGSGFGPSLLTAAIVLEPALFGSLIGLCILRRWANGLHLHAQWAIGIAVPVMVTGMLAWSMTSFAFPGDGGWHPEWMLSRMLLAAGCAIVLLEYFRLRARAYAPSFSEARLQALQARIRPHFLFNSLNTVLGLIRSDPRRAEQTLENLADLFRVFMRDARELVPLDDEVLTCKEYLAIEQLRLTNRLKTVWDIDEMPGDALIPSLLLQPLLENAVHHGIEPRTSQGTLNIRITRPGERVRVDIDNPLSPNPPTRSGNQMALSNVRERLMLLYDMEAELKTFTRDERFYLQLEFPYRKERRRRDVRRHHIHPDR